MSAPSEVRCRPIGPGDWPVVAHLFGANGACGGCWCMWWRVPKGGKAWEEAKGEPNRKSFKRLVESGAAHGILAFAGEEPVGWCSFGPREAFPRLETVRALRGARPDGTWCVICFYIRAGWRGRGVATRLIEAATERCFALGAAAVEGYPVVPKNPPELVPAAFAWTGVPALFRAAGYREVGRPGASRPVFVRERPAGDRDGSAPR